MQGREENTRVVEGLLKSSLTRKALLEPSVGLPFFYFPRADKNERWTVIVTTAEVGICTT